MPGPMPMVSEDSPAVPVVGGGSSGRGPLQRLRALTGDGTKVLLPMLLAVFAMLVASWVSMRWYETDQWFFLSTGREILEHGIPYENPFSVWHGMRIVVQQWLFCVLVWVEWSVGGWFAVAAAGVLRLLIMCACVFWYMHVTARNLDATDRLLVLLLSFPLLVSFERNNPRIYDKAFFFLVLGLLESYARTGNRRWLCLLPCVMILHMNLHASLAVMDLILVCVYVLPDVRGVRGRLGGRAYGVGRQSVEVRPYRRLPILVCLVAMALAMVVNPYGTDGILYLWRSIGSASYMNQISEMLPMTLVGVYRMSGPTVAIFLGAGTLSLVLLVLSAAKGRYVQPNAIILLGFSVAGFLQERSFTLLGVPMVMVFSQWLSAFREEEGTLSPVYVIPSPSPVISEGTSRLVWACCLAVAVLGCGSMLAHPSTMREIEAPTSDSGDLHLCYCTVPDVMGDAAWTSHNRVLCHTNVGAYLELKGFRVSTDTRPEIWDHGVAGGTVDHYKDYVDAGLESDPTEDGSLTSKFVQSADFDWAVVGGNGNFDAYLKAHPDSWRKVGANSGYVFYQRIR